LRLKCDGLLSSFAFKFNLRHYNLCNADDSDDDNDDGDDDDDDDGFEYGPISEVRRCRLTLSNPI